MNESFLALLARPEPIPGGGAAAAYAASVGLALLEKIVRVEMRRGEVLLGQSLVWEDLLSKLVQLAEAFARLRDEDGEAYLRWAKITAAEENVTALQDALQAATACPISIAERVLESLECAAETGQFVKKHLLSDLLVVCEILNGAGKGAAHIALANLHVMTDSVEKNALETQLAGLQTLADQSYKRVREEIFRRLYPSREACFDLD
jgi:formiminotetrahydrofolate cyclodeaminase